MIYILDKAGRVVGSASAVVDAADLAARGARMIVSDLALPLAEVEVANFPANPAIIARRAAASAGAITLSTSAADADGDGLAELPANGRSKAAITATLHDAAGNLVAAPTEVRFRTTAGALSARAATTEQGVCAIQLTASRDTVLAHLSAAAEGFAPARISLEFVPPEK